MEGNNSYPNSQDNFMIFTVWVYTNLLRTFTNMVKNYNPHFILFFTDFIITPNSKCKEWNRMFGRFRERTKFAGIIKEVKAGHKCCLKPSKD